MDDIEALRRFGMDTGNAEVGDDSPEQGKVMAWRLHNEDAGKVVKVRAVAEVEKYAGKKIAVMARVMAHDLVLTGEADSWAGVGYSFLDGKGKETGEPVLLAVSDTKTYHQAVMATLDVPQGAKEVMVTVAMSKATGEMMAGNIVVAPVDEEKAAPPAAVMALHRAIRKGNVAQVQAMIEGDRRLLECRNMEQTGSTPLEIAAGRNKADMVDMLLGMGADPKARDVTIMWNAADTAAVQGAAETLEVLLAKTDVDLDEAAYYVEQGKAKPPGGAPIVRDYDACIELIEKARGLKGSATTKP